MKPRVLVIGLDCGSFRFINPHRGQGWLPNLGRLMRQGATRVLKSTVPPISPPAWATFLTGKNPGQHGIFHFADVDVRDYAFVGNHLVNSSLFSGQTFVDFIGRRGLTTGMVKIPFTYPPWKVKGFMVAGEPSPNWKKAHTYPPELSESIGRGNIGTSIDFIRYGTKDLLRHLRFDCAARTEIACNMLERGDCDLFVVVHNITDAAAHRFWKFTDPSCPNYRESFDRYKDIIRDVYVLADRSIEQILEKTDEGTTVFVMSDHGASRKPIRFFRPNAWLRDMGYLRTRQKMASAKYTGSILRTMKLLRPPVARQVVRHQLRRRFPKRFAAFQMCPVDVEWSHTKAYAINLHARCDGIALNLRGRQPGGIVEPGSVAERLCDEIRSGLLELKDPRTGDGVVERVCRRDEVFQGDFAEKMPELIVHYRPDYRGGPSTASPLFSDVPANDFEFQSGDHDEDGIFIAAGPHIRRGVELGPAKIQDMAPTILYAMGLPVPRDMDGQVMLDIFEQRFVAEHAVEKASCKPHMGAELRELSEDESDDIKRQLQGLGYM